MFLAGDIWKLAGLVPVKWHVVALKMQRFRDLTEPRREKYGSPDVEAGA
jgi:hypothetical protein